MYDLTSTCRVVSYCVVRFGESRTPCQALLGRHFFMCKTSIDFFQWSRGINEEVEAPFIAREEFQPLKLLIGGLGQSGAG